MPEQPALPVEPSAVAAEPAPGLHDPMTRDHERHWVARVRGSDRPRGMGLPHRRGDLAVSARLPGGDGAQRRPHDPLERRALDVDGYALERFELAVEVRREALPGASRIRRTLGLESTEAALEVPGQRLTAFAAIGEFEAAQPVFARVQRHRTDGCLHLQRLENHHRLLSESLSSTSP